MGRNTAAVDISRFVRSVSVISGQTSAGADASSTVVVTTTGWAMGTTKEATGTTFFVRKKYHKGNPHVPQARAGLGEICSARARPRSPDRPLRARLSRRRGRDGAGLGRDDARQTRLREAVRAQKHPSAFRERSRLSRDVPRRGADRQRDPTPKRGAGLRSRRGGSTPLSRDGVRGG